MARRVKVYMGSLEKKNFKLRKVAATFVLATSIVCNLVGCGKKDDFSFSSSSNTNTTYEDTKENNTIISDIYQAPEIEYSTLNFNNVKYTSEADNYFQNYLSTLNVKYDYSELFNTEKALELYENEDKSEVVHTHDFLNGGTTVDADKLYDVVIANNKTYLKEHKVSLYKDLSKKELQKVLTIVADTINAYISEHPGIDLESLSCTLGDLKVFEKTSTVNAYVSDDGVLAINPPMMNIMIKKYEMKGIDAYRNIVMHEAIHLIQRMCEDERIKKPGYFVGMSRKYDELDMNTLDFAWLYEGAAEKNVSNMTGDIPLVYNTMITYLNSLNLSIFLNDNNGVTEAESLDCYKELNGLFEMFGATTKEEKIELINMMVSINIIQMEPEDFIKKYEETYNKTFSDDEVLTEVKCTMKAQVMETLTKYFYKNLSRKIANQEIAIEDAFALITYFEEDVNLHIKYTNSNYNTYNENFVRNYVELQNEFFYALSLSEMYNLEEIQAKFDEYNLKAYDKDGKLQDNYSFVWMGDEKYVYIQKYASEISSKDHESIRHNLSRVYESSNQLIK